MANQRSVVPWFQLYAWTVYGIGTYLTILPQAGPHQWASLIAIKLFRTTLGFIASVVLIRIYHRLHGRSLGSHTLVVLLSSTTLGAAWCVTFLTVMALARGVAIPWTIMPRESIDYTFVLLAWSWGYLALHFWGTATRAVGRVTELELEALRYQLNPHFLFNALNSIRASIAPDALAARAMIGDLSRFLRHTLESAPTTLTPLREEIAAVESYLAIERRRFAGRLAVDLDIHPSTANIMVPGLLLHPLVENAIKHGLPNQSEDEAPMALRVVAAQSPNAIAIEVANTGTLAPRDGTTPGLGIGLRNVRERLERVFPNTASFALEQDGSWVRGRIEIRRARV